MKNTKKSKKLVLAKTTLRALSASHMQDVAGGGITIPQCITFQFCNTQKSCPME